MSFLAQTVITHSNCHKEVCHLIFLKIKALSESFTTALGLRFLAKIPGVLCELSIAVGDVAPPDVRDRTVSTTHSPVGASQLSWPRWLLARSKRRPVARICFQTLTLCTVP